MIKRETWGWVLIILGILFLLSSLGILTIKIFATITRYAWPIILIYLGLKLMRKKPVSSKKNYIEAEFSKKTPNA